MSLISQSARVLVNYTGLLRLHCTRYGRGPEIQEVF